MKKITTSMLCFILSLFLVSCSSQKKEQISLTVWSSESNQEILKTMTEAFCEHYKEEADLQINIGEQSEDDFKNNYLENVEDSADVFSFPDDQLYDLVKADSLAPYTIEKDTIIENCGGKDSTAIQCAMQNGELYGSPMTASNGYFLFYDSRYFTEDDVKTLDRILEVAEQKGKKFAMDWSSGWYLYSFFGGAGFDLYFDDEKEVNICNWNQKVNGIKGMDVAEALLQISSHESFSSKNNDEFVEGVESGEVIAGVSGTWNVEIVKKAFGDGYAAAKLPTYTVAGKQMQMASFSGYKLVGINATSEHPDWAEKLAVWITNEENQTLRFEETGEGPANINAANSEKVKEAPAIRALTEQSRYSVVQNVGENFWDASTAFGMMMASGNRDGLNLQEILDQMVEKITAP